MTNVASEEKPFLRETLCVMSVLRRVKRLVKNNSTYFLIK